MLSLIDGEISEEEFIQKTIEKNWQYAKRQMTWLKRDDSIEWYKRENVEGIFTRISEFLS